MATTTINSGYLGAGITLAGDYVLTNTDTGTITNTAAAVFGVSGNLPNTVVNAGSIAGGGGAGITLLSGGAVTNQNSGIIGGASGTTVAGVGITGGAGTVTNFGRVTASGTGVRLEAGGTVANQTGGTIIAGYRGVSVGGGPDAVTNAGLISAAASGIVVYGTGGSAVNQTGGTILAGADGIYVSAGTATNQGVINATRHGIFMNAGATVSNRSGGAISGTQNGVEVIGGGLVANESGGTITGRYIGVDVSGASATVTNAGDIGATEPGIALAVRFGAGFSNRLIVDPGAVFNGTVDGGNTIGGPATSTLELASAAGVGTVSAIGTKYINFAAIEVDAGASWTFSATNLITAGVTLTNSGTLINAGSLNASAGVLIDSGSLANSGSLGGTVIMTGGAVLSNATAALFNGAIYAASGGAARTVINAGTITVAADVSVINMQSAGTVSNASGGTIAGIRGVDISGSASINNQGLMLATGAPGTNGSGVILRSDGTVSNGAGATISGQFYGVVFGTGAGFVTNGGSIHGGGVVGVALNHGGSVTNQDGATITGHYDGIVIHNTPGTVSNAGYIGGAGTGSGIVVDGGGSVTNLAGGTVAGTGLGILLSGVAGTVSNAGSVTGGGGNAVILAAGGTFLNAPLGSVGGYGGVTVSGGPGTVFNQGVIAASGPRGVVLSAGFVNRVAVEPGASFTGSVDGGNTIGSTFVSTLELGTGSSAGSIGGIGTQFINFAQVALDAGAAWVLTGSNSIAAGGVLTDNGTLTVSGSLTSDGTIHLGGGTLVAGILGGTGVIDMGAGSNLLSVSGSSTETINGFDGTDMIDLPSLTFAAGATAVVSGGTLTVTSNAVSIRLSVGGLADGMTYAVSKDSGTGSVVVACYAESTRIATEYGEIAVEDLRVGDRVRGILSGRFQPVRWLGHRRVNCAWHATPERVWPVRVSAHAFGIGVPRRDLFLSPDHAVYVNEVLIPIGRLVNGITIRQVPVAEISYWHVELPDHDVILAEGLPAESYLDTGGRVNFANSGSLVCLHPDFAARTWEAAGCAPLIMHGPKLEAARALTASLTPPLGLTG